MAWLFESLGIRVPKSGDAGRVRTAVKAAFADLSSAVGLGRWGGKGADLRNQRKWGGVAEDMGAGGVSKSFQHIS